MLCGARMRRDNNERNNMRSRCSVVYDSHASVRRGGGKAGKKNIVC